ncbi:MAG: putative flap endonuclease-1-like 5' DNA nuclease [Candidatus Poriferisodalaceae bacterium]|jgi:predicted flap endonuclease-1-like 5' DNA nuclease
MLTVLWEIIVPLLLAFFIGLSAYRPIGLSVGWLLWRRRRASLFAAEYHDAQGRLYVAQGEVLNHRDNADRRVLEIGQLSVERHELIEVQGLLSESLREEQQGAVGREIQLESDLKARSAQAADLEAEVVEARRIADGLRSSKEFAAAQAVVGECEVTNEADDVGSQWVVGTTTLGAPGAAHTDDLKVINGIGPKMESILNAFGITAWEQLAAFGPVDVEKVTAAIDAFPGRIDRDQWVPQANDLVTRFPDVTDRPKRATLLNEFKCD